MRTVFLVMALLVAPNAILIGEAKREGPWVPDTQLPCADPRGCPDLVVDDLQLLRGSQTTEEFAEGDCAVQEGAVQAGNRTLVRFTFNSPNIGDGSLMVGAPADHPDLFVYHLCHNHYHFIEYADYRLWTLDGFPEWDQLRNDNPNMTAKQVLRQNRHLKDDFVAGHKQGFCMIDILPAMPTRHGVAVPPDPFVRFDDCATNQGISRGWADVYGSALEGQWIDVTGVPIGVYVLEAEVNAERLFAERDYANNRAFVPVFVGVSTTEPPGGGIGGVPGVVIGGE